MYREFVDSREGFDAATEAAMSAQEQGYYDAEYEAWLDDLEEDYDDTGTFMDESMDGDFDSGMASAGFGTDEDYGYYGEDGEW